MEPMTAAEAAEYLGVSGALVRRYCRQGRFGVKIGRDWIITRAELDAYKSKPRRKPGRPPAKEGEC